MLTAGPSELNTAAMLGRANRLLGFQIVDGVVGTGFPQKPSHSAVFVHISPSSSRLTHLARGANVTLQAMGELVDELEDLGYVERHADPTDGRAKLIVLTPRGHASSLPASKRSTASSPGSPRPSASAAMTSFGPC